MNILKAGLQTAHRLVAVSRGYAWECQTQDGGWGLDMVRQCCSQLTAIVSGILSKGLVSDLKKFNKDICHMVPDSRFY